MAFNISGNPISCDTGSVADFNAALMQLNWQKQFIEVTAIVWQNAAAVGDRFILHNSFGDEVVNATCNTPNNDFWMNVNGSIHGLILVTLDSGNIKIFLRGK